MSNSDFGRISFATSSIGRSQRFNNFLMEQPLEQRKAIQQAERAYVHSRPKLENDSLEIAVEEAMEGYAEQGG